MTKRTNFLAPATRTLLAAFSLMLSVPVMADNSSGKTCVTQSAVSAAMLLDASGFTDQLGWLPPAVANSFHALVTREGVAAPFELEDVPALEQAVAAAFSTQALRSAMLAELNDGLSACDKSRLITFYTSDRGLIMRKAELSRSILHNADGFNTWYVQAGFDSLTAQRQRAIRDLEYALQATQSAVDTMIGMQVAMQVSLTPALPASEQLPAHELMSAAQQLRPELTRAYQVSTLQSLAYIFHEQSLDELRAYAAMLKTGAGQRYVTATNNGLSRGLFSAAEQLGVSIQRILAGRLGQGV